MFWLSDEDEEIEPYDEDDLAPSDQLSDMLDDTSDEESDAYDELLGEAWSEEELEDMHDATDVEDYG